MNIPIQEIEANLLTKTVKQYATELTDRMIAEYPELKIDRAATITYFERLTEPHKPKTVRATDLARAMGIEVREF